MQTYEVVTAFPYNGRRRQAGERIEIDSKYAPLLLALGKIKEPSGEKRSYKRRDMRPEG